MDVIVIDDMTYQKIKEAKNSIEEFVCKIKSISIENNFDFTQYDRDFFSFISKHIIFFKCLFIWNGTNKYFYKVLISDFYYFILSIIKTEKRYVYVNERSIIENYMRIIMKNSLCYGYVTAKSFTQLRQKKFNCFFSDSEYSLIRSEYTTACNFIHGGNVLNDSLIYDLQECMNNNFPISKRKEYYNRLIRTLKIFDRLLISENAIYINGCFHREKSFLGYLIGSQQVDLLFQIINR